MTKSMFAQTVPVEWRGIEQPNAFQVGSPDSIDRLRLWKLRVEIAKGSTAKAELCHLQCCFTKLARLVEIHR